MGPEGGEGFYRELLDHMSDGVYFVDRDRRITYWSAGAERLTGFAADDVVGRHCRDRVLNHCDDAGELLCGSRCPLQATMYDGRPREARVWMRHKAGHRQPVWVRGAPLRTPDGDIVGAVETFTDDRAVAAIRERLADAERLALTDALTGLGNRRYLEVQLLSRLDERVRYGWACGVLFVDVDRFKSVNDDFGHEVGDDVLRMVARTMLYGCRPSDTITRFGGEEFVVLLPQVDRPALVAAAERLRHLVSQSCLYMGQHKVEVTISLGGTLMQEPDTAETVLRRADTMLLEAKGSGRDRTCLD